MVFLVRGMVLFAGQGVNRGFGNEAFRGSPTKPPVGWF